MSTEINITYGEAQDITPPGLDGRKWRYDATVSPRSELPGTLHLRLEVTVTGSALAVIDADGDELEKRVFLAAHRLVESSLLRGGVDEGPIEVMVDSRKAGWFKQLDVSAIPPAGTRVYRFDFEARQPIGFDDAAEP